MESNALPDPDAEPFHLGSALSALLNQLTQICLALVVLVLYPFRVFTAIITGTIGVYYLFHCPRHAFRGSGAAAGAQMALWPAACLAWGR